MKRKLHRAQVFLFLSTMIAFMAPVARAHTGKRAQCRTTPSSRIIGKRYSEGKTLGKLQLRVGSRFIDAPEKPLYIMKGTQVTFKFVPNSRFLKHGNAARWNRTRWNKVRWSRAGRNIGRGQIKTVLFDVVSSHRADYKIVTVQDGNRLHVRVIVYDLEPILIPADNFPGRSMDSYGIGEKIYLSFHAVPSISAAEAGGLE